jgi:hypothetical protein
MKLERMSYISITIPAFYTEASASNTNNPSLLPSAPLTHTNYILLTRFAMFSTNL